MSDTATQVREIFGDKLRLRVSGICIENDKILMVKHQYIGKKDYLWAPPGGGLIFGESAEDTLKREFLEETGLEINVIRFLFVNEFLDPPLHAVELFFEVAIVGGILIKGEDPEMGNENQIIQEVGFLSVEDIKEEKPLNLHSRIREIQNLEHILTQKGYFFSKN